MFYNQAAFHRLHSAKLLFGTKMHCVWCKDIAYARQLFDMVQACESELFGQQGLNAAFMVVRIATQCSVIFKNNGTKRMICVRFSELTPEFLNSENLFIYKSSYSGKFFDPIPCQCNLEVSV